MQGNPLSPTIFNVVVDAVICHWVTVVMPSEAVTGGFGMTIIDLAAYFHAGVSLVASKRLGRLQMGLDVLTGPFDRVDLKENMEKTVGMVYQPCHASGGMSEEAYARRVTEKGPTFWER